MSFLPGIGIIVAVVYLLAVVAIIVLVVLAARLALAATRTLDTVTEERRLRIDLLIAERGGDLEE